MKQKILKQMVKMMEAKKTEADIVSLAIEKELNKNKDMHLMKKAFSTKFGIKSDIRVVPIVAEPSFNIEEWVVVINDKPVSRHAGYDQVYAYLIEGSLSKDEAIVNSYIEDLKVVR